MEEQMDMGDASPAPSPAPAPALDHFTGQILKKKVGRPKGSKDKTPRIRSPDKPREEELRPPTPQREESQHEPINPAKHNAYILEDVDGGTVAKKDKLHVPVKLGNLENMYIKDPQIGFGVFDEWFEANERPDKKFYEKICITKRNLIEASESADQEKVSKFGVALRDLGTKVTDMPQDNGYERLANKWMTRSYHMLDKFQATQLMPKPFIQDTDELGIPKENSNGVPIDKDDYTETDLDSQKTEFRKNFRMITNAFALAFDAYLENEGETDMNLYIQQLANKRYKKIQKEENSKMLGKRGSRATPTNSSRKRARIEIADDDDTDSESDDDDL